MRLGKYSRFSPIGIDIGRRFIKAAQIEQRGEIETVNAYTILERVEDSSLINVIEAQRLQEALVRRGFRGNKVVLGAPDDKLVCEMFELPPRKSGAPIENIARSEISSIANFGGAAFECGTWDLPVPARANVGTTVMAVALREDDAESLLAPFDSVRLDVLGIMAPITAMVGACAAEIEKDKILAILDVGWDCSFLVLCGSDMVLYQRKLKDSGLGALCRDISNRFDISNEATELLISDQTGAASPNPQHSERWRWINDQMMQFAARLANLVHASLSYAQNRYSDRTLDLLLISGGGANLSGLYTALETQLRLPSRTVAAREIGLGEGSRLANIDAARLAIAVGLARQGGGDAC